MADTDGKITTYTVVSGDNPTKIARHFGENGFPGLTPAQLMQANGITDATKISIGRELVIPSRIVAQETEKPAAKDEDTIQKRPFAAPETETPKPTPSVDELQDRGTIHEIKPAVKSEVKAPVEAPSPAAEVSPSQAKVYTYIVPDGATLSGMARDFDTSIGAIASANGLNPDGSNLQKSATIKIIPGADYSGHAADGLKEVALSADVASQAADAVDTLNFNKGVKGSLILTFDDGPNPKKVTHNNKTQSITEHILDELDAHGAKGVFFVNGTHVLTESGKKLGEDAAHMFTDGADRNSLLSSEGVRLLKEIDARGHTIATHTTFHFDQARLSSQGLKEQLNVDRDGDGKLDVVKISAKQVLGRAFEQLNAMPEAEQQPFVEAFAKGLGVPQDQVKFEVGANWEAQYIVWSNTFTSELVREFTGQDAPISRAPYGSLNQQARDVLDRLGKPHLGWDIDSEDWKMDSSKFKQTEATTRDKILENGLVKEDAGHLSEPKVVLMHEREKTLKGVISPVLDKLNERGYSMDAVPGQDSKETQIASDVGKGRG